MTREDWKRICNDSRRAWEEGHAHGLAAGHSWLVPSMCAECERLYSISHDASVAASGPHVVSLRRVQAAIQQIEGIPPFLYPPALDAISALLEELIAEGLARTR